MLVNMQRSVSVCFVFGVLLALAGCAQGVPSGLGSAGDAGPSTCNNGVIDLSEECDGANLGSATCESLGNGPGTLGCDAVMCKYDTSMCMMTATPGGGASGG